MRKVYWRPHKVSRVELVLITALALGAFFCVERFQVVVEQPHYAEKLAASRLARRAMEAIRDERLKLGHTIDAETDPVGSGLIGPVMSEVTTNTGHLLAKQTTVNPNFAALVVGYLKRAGVEKGDAVAVGASGSFPALNICVYAALEALGAKPLVISSVSGSQFGANDPTMMWLDMERVLFERRVFSFRSIAASRGGIEDKALGVSKEGRRLLDQAIERNGIPAIRPAEYEASVEERMQQYRTGAGEPGVKVYVNIGGGTTSVGTKVGKLMFKPGLNREAPPGLRGLDSVMARFAYDGVPVVHLVQIVELATRNGFPVPPLSMPEVGQGHIFTRREYNLWLAFGSVVVVFGLLFAFIRLDIGARLLKGASRDTNRKPPEQMV